MVPGLKSVVYKVSYTPWTLFASAALSTLSPLSAAPTVDFKVKVTLAGGTSNSGTVTINGSLDGVSKTETLTFTAAGIKQCTLTLDTVTSITTTGLADEAVKPTVTVTCYDTSGAAINHETLTSIKAGWRVKRNTQNTGGANFTTDNSFVLTTDTTVQNGTVLRYNGKDYQVQEFETITKPSGRIFLLKLYMGKYGWQ